MRYGVWAIRLATSRLGPAETWCVHEGVREEFDTRDAAEARAREIHAKMNHNPNLKYEAREIV